MSSGSARKPSRVARGTGKVVPSRLNAVTGSHNSALCRYSPALLIVERARQGQEPEAAAAPLRTGGPRRSGGSNVGCSHAEGCPLFPLLRASLQGWRDYYCDSVDQWHDCARYQLSLTGERVPISLLPNGATARHLEGTSGASRSSATNSAQTPRQAPRPPQQPQPQPQPDAWSQSIPAGPPEPASPGPEQPGSAAWFGAAPAAPAPSGQPSPHAPSPHTPSPHTLAAYTPSFHAQAPHPPTPQPSGRTARPSGQAASAKRGLLGRLADWMRGPA